MSEQTNGNGTLGSDLVERGVSALREKERDIPALPEALIRRTIARVGAGEIRVSKGEGWWSMKMVRRYAVAAGLTALAGMAVAWGLLGRGTSVAFADVVEQVKAVKAARCTLTVTTASPQPGKLTAFDVLMVEPGWVVEKGSGMTMIMNSEKHKMITLTEADKQALVIDVQKEAVTTGGGPQAFNLLETFKNANGQASRPLGEREIAGHPTAGFEFAKGGMEMQVWADKKTELPVLVEMSMGGFGSAAGAATQGAVGEEKGAVTMGQIRMGTPGNGVMVPAGGAVATVTEDGKVRGGFLQMRATFSDFDWNPTYDASELTTEIPAGYAVTSTAMNLQGPTEQDVVGMLKAFGEMNGGVMPKGVGVRDLGEVMAKKMQGKMPANMTSLPAEERQKLQQQMTAEAMKMAEPIARGWVFMGDAKFGKDWRYAGGAVVGEKGTAVLWYKPAGKEMWRVIDADGAVHEEKAAPSGGEAVGLFGVPGGSAK